jgi:hypothetical protein
MLSLLDWPLAWASTGPLSAICCSCRRLGKEAEGLGRRGRALAAGGGPTIWRNKVGGNKDVFCGGKSFLNAGKMMEKGGRKLGNKIWLIFRRTLIYLLYNFMWGGRLLSGGQVYWSRRMAGLFPAPFPPFPAFFLGFTALHFGALFLGRKRIRSGEGITEFCWPN